MKKSVEGSIIECHKHWSGYILPSVIALITIASVIIPILIVLYMVLSAKYNYIALTDSQVIGRKGIIRSTTLSTPLSKVQGISLSNGLFGKIFGYHTIAITSAGTGGIEYTFKCMANAEIFSSEVKKRI